MAATRATTSSAEVRVQLGLTLAIGLVAACASWSHVLALAALHGQGGWLAWAVAACIETGAVSAGLEVRRRRRVGASSAFPLGVLVAATVLQLAAQVAQAERSPWGVVLAAVPAVTFLVLVKLTVARASSLPPVAVSRGPAQAATPQRPDPEPRPAPSRPAPVRAPAVARPAPAGSDELLAAAQVVAGELAAGGAGLTRAALVRGLRERGVPVGNARAGELLAALRTEPAALQAPELQAPAPEPASDEQDQDEHHVISENGHDAGRGRLAVVGGETR